MYPDVRVAPNLHGSNDPNSLHFLLEIKFLYGKNFRFFFFYIMLNNTCKQTLFQVLIFQVLI